MPKPGSKLFVIWPDTHYPNHDETAVAVATNAVRILRPYCTLFLGDLLEAAPFSSHPRKSLSEDSVDNFVQSEIEPANALIDTLRKYSKRVDMVEGNHEYRVQRWALAAESNRASFPSVDPARLLHIDTWVPYVDHGLPHYKIAPDLWAVHGWSHSKHAANAHLQRTTDFSIVHGHTHRQQLDTRRDLRTNRAIKAFSPGCLCKFQPIYRHSQPTDWTHGLSLVYVGRKGSWTDYICTIDNGSLVLPDGREVKA